MKTKFLALAITATLAVSAIIIFHACKKVDLNRVTKCNVESVTVVNATTVKVEVDIFDLSPADHPDYGICYSSTNATPTLADSKVSMGAITEYIKYNKNIENLTAGTKYYFRGYVMNGSEPKYSFNVKDVSTPSSPTVITTTASSIAQTTATSGGNVTSDGGATVTARGVCWSTSQNPVATGSHTTDGTGTGVFTSSITGLTASTLYYVRAYATNSAGTSYGNEISFTTSSPCPATVPDYDGNTYNIVTIGSQCWMKENLKTTHYANGTAMVDGTSAGDITGNYTTKYYFDYANTPSNTATYGKLYTWAAAMNGAASSAANPSGVQGVCPTGWHLPSDAEWTQLTDYLGGGSVAGGKMKEAGTTHWNSPNTGADNSSGFSALPGGGRSSYGTFYSVGDYGYWWCSTEYSTSDAWRWYLSYDNSHVYSYINDKSFGFSVRCLRD
ncbi:MAG: fibrobacter succinogenes major paralogous domain-containing protein [Bacteroidia bacterium]|nr:fibrobacter succinogenes major paralogous domain-containing protein [Bacteroidia bacterium]